MRRFVAIATVLVTVAVLVACSSSSSSLTGRTWKLTSVTLTGTGSALPPGVVAVADQAKYTITFNADGTFNADADCNKVSGSYTTSGNSISIKPGPSTLVACPAGGFGDAYVTALGQAATYAAGGSVLTLTLNGGDSLTFG